MMRNMLIALAVMSAAMLPVAAQTPLADEYTRMLADTPDDYDLLLSRAAEYKSAGMLLPALADLNRTLDLTPKGEKEIRFEALLMRGEILKLQRDYNAALADLTEAHELFVEAAAPLSERADVYLRAGRTAEARADFLEVLRMFPRDPQATFGVARVAAACGDSDEAMLYADRGVALAPRSGSSFRAKAEVLQLLGRNDDAIDRYIDAIFCDDAESGTAAQALIDLSYRDYPGVYQGFTRAVNAQPGNGTLYYLRGSIAEEHRHYADALSDYRRINYTGPFVDGRLNTTVASTLYGMGDYIQATETLDKVPQRFRDAGYHTLAARIALARNHTAKALEQADSALMLADDDVDALTVKALALAADARQAEAASTLARAIMSDNSRPAPYLLRANVLFALGRESEARSVIEQMLDLDFDPADPTSLRGFGLMLTGNDEQADGWIAGVTAHADDSDGRTSMIAAIYWAQRNQTARAAELLDAALAKGYADKSLTDRYLPDNTAYKEVMARYR